MNFFTIYIYFRSDTMCLLCGDRSLTHLGQFLPSLNCHLLCVKFASGIVNRNVPPKGNLKMILPMIRLLFFSDIEIVREVKRSRKLTCVYCRKKGASVGCNIKVGVGNIRWFSMSPIFSNVFELFT